ncbi:hypothetical protein [Bacillus sp. SRB1LM]|uniref:hypothetical protein n=1 Tax=Bacillus sp. SRB1LM TaxID=2608688 RepID=UPI0018C38BE8|nr:hypothetical protein [Bacillus sp. SRB1LM]
MYQSLNPAELKNAEIKLLEKILGSQDNPVEFYYEILSMLNLMEHQNKGGRAS